jgi:hypothetical protein
MVQNTYRVPYSGFPHEETRRSRFGSPETGVIGAFRREPVQATGETDSLLEQWDSNRRSPLAKVRVIFGEEKRPEVIAWSRKDVVFSPGGPVVRISFPPAGSGTHPTDGRFTPHSPRAQGPSV